MKLFLEKIRFKVIKNSIVSGYIITIKQMKAFLNHFPTLPVKCIEKKLNF
jgi:hypothetical protein